MHASQIASSLHSFLFLPTSINMWNLSPVHYRTCQIIEWFMSLTPCVTPVWTRRGLWLKTGQLVVVYSLVKSNKTAPPFSDYGSTLTFSKKWPSKSSRGTDGHILWWQIWRTNGYQETETVIHRNVAFLPYWSIHRPTCTSAVNLVRKWKPYSPLHFDLIYIFSAPFLSSPQCLPSGLLLCPGPPVVGEKGHVPFLFTQLASYWETMTRVSDSRLPWWASTWRSSQWTCHLNLFTCSLQGNALAIEFGLKHSIWSYWDLI